MLSHRFIFSDAFEAIDFMYVLKDMSIEYEHVNIAEALELIGKSSQFSQTMYGWDKSNFDIDFTHVEDEDVTLYVVIMPPVKKIEGE